MWNSLPWRLQRREILPAAWNFSQGLCVGWPGQGLAGKGLFIFCGDLDFSPYFLACAKHAWGLPTQLAAASCPEGIHRKWVTAQVALKC